MNGGRCTKNNGFLTVENVSLVVRLDGHLVQAVVLPPIPAGAEAAIPFQLDLKGVPNGVHEVAVVFDPADLVPEESEANNALSTLVYVQGNKVANLADEGASRSSTTGARAESDTDDVEVSGSPENPPL